MRALGKSSGKPKELLSPHRRLTRCNKSEIKFPALERDEGKKSKPKDWREI
jgi:hypothetical protein